MTCAGARRTGLLAGTGVLTMLVAALAATPVMAAPGTHVPRGPHFSHAVAADTSPPLRVLARRPPSVRPGAGGEIRPDRGPTAVDRGHSGDGVVQSQAGTASLGGTLANFDGLSNQDNFDIFGFRVNPPDPVGDVGPSHYVEMVNLAYAVYDKAGNPLVGPADTGTLWAGFPVEDCTDPSGDPIVLYDQTVDRWILSQFTTRGFDPATPDAPFYDCVAISATGDPTGAYHRYAFITQPDPDGGYFFPDYPKYGVWSNSYVLTTRDFGFAGGYGISVYALEKNKMLAGDPKARAVQFFLDAEQVPISLIGDGLLPPDLDGHRRPVPNDAPAPIVGTQDDGAFYGADRDALNVWELAVRWRSTPTATLMLKQQLPVAPFDSIFPCGGSPGQSARDCLPQPGVARTAPNLLDILSYRQRPTWRLAYRNFGGHEALVTNQSVEARPGVAGVRWYEIRRLDGTYVIHQEGTYAPDDGVHRWMGSAAMDRNGDIALGYSVVNGVDVFPGIRYTGRLSSDPPGEMTLGEGTIVDGSGVQRTTNSRWGDYTSLNVDPSDDCTFWYVNEYYSAESAASALNGWLTRIASFRLPRCGG